MPPVPIEAEWSFLVSKYQRGADARVEVLPSEAEKSGADSKRSVPGPGRSLNEGVSRMKMRILKILTALVTLVLAGGAHFKWYP